MVFMAVANNRTFCVAPQEFLTVGNRDYRHLSQFEIDGDKQISQHLSNLLPGFTEVDFRIADYSHTIGSDRDPPYRAVIADSRDSII